MSWAERYNGEPVGNVTPQLRRVEFDYLTLYKYYAPLLQAIGGGIASSQIDETTGRIIIGVPPNSIARVRSVVSQMDVPPSMVLVRPEEFAVRNTTLHDKVRPLVGGLYIYSPSANHECTLGMIGWKKDPETQWPDYSLGGFALTASHCTTSQYSVDGDVFGQPYLGFGGGDMGVEVDEAPVILNDGGYNCAHPKCQMADVAVISIRDTVSFYPGYVAKSSPATPLPYAPYLGRWSVTSSIQSASTGQPMTLVGAHSGQRSGTISGSCIDISTDGGTLFTNCAQKASMSTYYGDSGAPVFVYPNQPGISPSPRPIGIEFASNDIFTVTYWSPMPMVYNAIGYYWSF